MARTVTTAKIGAHGGVLGRPRIEPPADAAARIEKLATEGYLLVGIARKFEVSIDTLREWLREREDLREAMQAGKAAEEHRLVSRMSQIAENTEDLSAAVKAASYLLSTRHNYRDGGANSGQGESNVRITLELPAAMTVEQFRSAGEGKVINHDD